VYSQRTLLSATVTAAVTAQTAGEETGLDGMSGLVMEAIFTYGSGGTSAKAWVQTSLDGGTTWVDIACFAFTTSTANKVATVSARTPVTTVYAPTDGTLGDDTVKDGILGDRVRVKYTTVGTYADSTALKVVVQPKP
jgi:hypothetical protein